MKHIFSIGKGQVLVIILTEKQQEPWVPKPTILKPFDLFIRIQNESHILLAERIAYQLHRAPTEPEHPILWTYDWKADTMRS